MDVSTYLKDLGFHLISSSGSNQCYLDLKSGVIVSYDPASESFLTSFSDEVQICEEMVFDGFFTHSIRVLVHGLPSNS